MKELMMRNIILILSGTFLIISTIFSQTSYMNESENTKILKEILKEIGELKKGQDKLKKEITNLKSAAQANPSKGVASKSAKKDVPIGNSIVLGKKEAPVTIIKWTDFQ
tara:strand:- start:38 stop:364 length:327 start_codon:yes stop_codon:yes gene_type:complete